MKNYILVLLIIMASLLNANYKILEQSPQRIVIQFDIKEFSISEGKDFTFVNIPNWTTEAVPGSPDLPFIMLNVAIPPGGNIKTKLISKNRKNYVFKKPVSPIPRIQKGGKTFDFIYEIDSGLYSRKIVKTVQVLNETRYRYYSFIPIKISPFSYDAITKNITFCNNLILQIDIMGDTSFRNEIQDKFDLIYKDFILNYETSKYWRTRKIKKINSMPFEKSDFWYKFEVEQNALHKLTYDDLSQLPSFCEPDSIRILTMYRNTINDDPQNYEFELIEVPAFVDDSNDGTFDEDDNVYFFKENYEDPGLPIYSTQKIYWLTFGGDYKNKPLRINNMLNKNSAIPVENFQRKKITGYSTREDIDAIIIYPEENVFRSQSEEFRDIHSELSFELKSQEDIFAEYGQQDPLSIKQYLNDKFDDHPELMYVILMGAGTSDWNNPTEKNKIMVYDCSDDYFVYFNSIYHPVLSIGRLPAKNDNDMDFLIERIRKYIEEPTPGFWRNSVLLIADDENKSGGYEGFGSDNFNHSRNVQETGDVMNDSVYVDKVMAIEYGFDEYQNKPAARNDIIKKINEGRLIWYFVGHGNEDVLGDEDYFRGSLHTNLLDNEEYLPLFIAASCEVGMFDNPDFDCIPERLLLYENGGAIASIAARRGSSPGSNTKLMKYFFENVINKGYNLGFSLLDAKLNSTADDANSRYYNILGDPIMLITQPERGGAVYGIPDSLRSRQIIDINGDFGTGNSINDNGEIRVFESEYDITYINNDFVDVNNDTLAYTVDYTKNGNTFFYGEMQINSGNYNAQFIVPDDIHAGNKGRIINYVFDDNQNKDYISCYYPMKLSRIQIDTFSTNPPQVQLYLDSRTFIEGDYVSTDPVLIADIEDENGINILGSAGHKILILLDDSIEPIDVTNGFIYDLGSCTKGELTWQLTDLSEGTHALQLIVFDNFNIPTVAHTSFISKRSGKVAIEQMLPYPNPIEKDGHFTFVITEDSDITISIYTITGKKIRTIKKPACSAGYNQIYWNGKDGESDNIANNTYFYKIKARQISNGKNTEKIGKVIILK